LASHKTEKRPQNSLLKQSNELSQEERPLKADHVLGSLLLLALAAAIGSASASAVTAEDNSPINKSDPVAWFNEGCILLNLSKYNESIEAFSKALELNDSYAQAWAYKGAALLNLSKYNESLDCFHKANLLAPNYSKAWNGRGEALTALGRSAEADAALAKAEELVHAASEANPSTSKELNQRVDVSGHWDGKLFQLDQAFPYSLDLTQTGSDVKGTSRISLGPYYAVMDLSGSLSNGVLSFTETGTREHKDPPGTYFILKTADLHYISAPAQGLNGTWRCHDSPAAPCNYASPGNMSLAKEPAA
jgi:tetratricopeptide (TPR) repeat protein